MLRRGGVVAVTVHPNAQELDRLDLEAGFLDQLPLDRVQRMLGLVHEPSRQVPAALVGLERPAPEKDASHVVDAHRGRGRHGIGVRDEPALGTLDALLVAPQLRAAARAVLPAVQNSH